MNRIHLTFIHSEQETICSTMAGGSAPEARSLPNTLHQSRASSLTLQGSQWDSKGNISPKGSPISSAGGQGKMAPHCNVLSWVVVYINQKALEVLDVGAAYWSRDRLPRHSSPASSLEHTGHASHPVVIFHCCFMGYLVFCQLSHMAPSQPHGFKLHC